jgi:hypothetical protein
MKKNNTNTIVSYSDVDRARSYDRKSTTENCTFVRGNIMTWKSKKIECGYMIKRRSKIWSYDFNCKRTDLD